MHSYVNSNTMSPISRKLLPLPKTSKVKGLCSGGRRPSWQLLWKPITSTHHHPSGRTSCLQVCSNDEYHTFLPWEKEPRMLQFRESMINLCESNRHLKGSVHHSSLLQNSTTQFGSRVHTNLMLQRLALPNHKAVQLPGKVRKNQFPCCTKNSNFTSAVAPWTASHV